MTVYRGNSQDLAQLRPGHSVDRSETISKAEGWSRGQQSVVNVGAVLAAVRTA